MSKSSEYWARRAELNMELYQKAGEQHLKAIAKAMASAQKQLEEDVDRIIGTFARRFGMTEEQAIAYLEKNASQAEYKALFERLSTLEDGVEKQAIQMRLESGAYSQRISTLQTLQENIKIQVTKVSQVMQKEMDEQLTFTSVEGYNRRMYNLQMQTSNGFNVPDISGMKVAIDTPWSGTNYSSRIWKNREELAEKLQEAITSNFTSAKSNSQIAKEIAERFGVTFRNAERLVQTETSYIAGKADFKAYSDFGIEEYEYIATLDDRTCEICGPLDGEVRSVNEALVGVNYPPMHPRCRCTTGAADAERASKQRRGKGADGKDILLPADMSYEEWKKWQEAGSPSDIASWRGKAVAVKKPAAKKQKQAPQTKNVTENIVDGFKTNSEVCEQMKKNGWFKSSNKNDLNGVDLDVAKTVYKAYDKVFEKYPQLKGHFLGVQVAEIEGKAIANCVYKTGQITINSKYGNSFTKLKSTMTRTAASGFHTKGATPETVIAHEISHAIDGYISNGMKGIVGEKGFSTTLQKSTLSASGIKNIANDVSVYATNNPKEWFAEALSEYLTSDQPRSAAIAVGSKVDAVLKELR